MAVKHAVSKSSTLYVILLIIPLLLFVLFVPANVFPLSFQFEETSTSVHLDLPIDIKELHIDIGPNFSPMTPPRDQPQTAMLSVEPNIGIANYLRETYQKNSSYAGRFFTLCAAISGKPLSGRVASFRHYNDFGQSSSLSKVLNASLKDKSYGRSVSWSHPSRTATNRPDGPGPSGIDFVPVLSLGNLLMAVPSHVSIPLLKTDAQGHDLNIIKSSPIGVLRRVDRIRSEVYLGNIKELRYQGVNNDLEDWRVYMRKAGYKLMDDAPTGKSREWDATWVRISK